jgi:predicted transcriptional regulator of viral defense system
MPAADAFGDLLRMDARVVSTKEAAARMKSSSRTAYNRLKTMERSGLVRRAKQGLWILDPNLPEFALAPYLTAPLPAYVSLSSALAHHGLIEQIPRQISVVSTDRARRISTTLAIYSIHRIAPELFGGFEGEPSTGYVASPGKALFDSVYLRAATGSATYFPELEYSEDFDSETALNWLDRIDSVRLRTITERELLKVLPPGGR